MNEVLHTGRQKRRLWTAQDQVVAEVAAACGVSYRNIGQALGCAYSNVRCHLIPSAAKHRSERSRQWRNLNPERFKKTCRQWIEANRARRRANDNRWRAANLDKARQSSRKYYAANSERIKEKNRQWSVANISRHRELQRQWRIANPEGSRAAARRRQSLKRSARRKSLAPATALHIQNRFALWNNRCAFCGVTANNPRNIGHNRLTEEHVLPLSHRGLDEPDNIMPACHSCNSSKNAKPVETWYRSQPFFTEARWRKIQRHCPAAVVGQLSIGA
jgi:hypothetical protein